MNAPVRTDHSTRARPHAHLRPDELWPGLTVVLGHCPTRLTAVTPLDPDAPRPARTYELHTADGRHATLGAPDTVGVRFDHAVPARTLRPGARVLQAGHVCTVERVERVVAAWLAEPERLIHLRAADRLGDARRQGRPLPARTTAAGLRPGDTLQLPGVAGGQPVTTLQVTRLVRWDWRGPDGQAERRLMPARQRVAVPAP